MKALIKYEFRKSVMSKLIFIGITAVMEAVYLFGVLRKYEETMSIGMVGLTLTALAGIGFIGIESILILYRDLTTKQSYMLFMTPNSSYKILGAKALENAFAVMLCGFFFGGLAFLDFSILMKQADIAIAEIIQFFTEMLKSISPQLELSARALFVVLFMMLCSWILRIITGYLAIVLACTLLSGRKGAAVISFLFFIGISLLISWISTKIPFPEGTVAGLMAQSCVLLAWSVVMYFATAYLMDKKLSV